MQGWGQENQSPPGTQSVKGHKTQQAELLWGISSKRKSRENVETAAEWHRESGEKYMQEARVLGAFVVSVYW